MGQTWQWYSYVNLRFSRFTCCRYGMMKRVKQDCEIASSFLLAMTYLQAARVSPVSRIAGMGW